MVVPAGIRRVHRRVERVQDGSSRVSLKRVDYVPKFESPEKGERLKSLMLEGGSG